MATETETTRPSYSDTDLLRALHDADTSLTTGEVADQLGCDRSTSQRRLKSLYREGFVDRNEIAGGHVYQYHLTDEGRREVEEQ